MWTFLKRQSPTESTHPPHFNMKVILFMAVSVNGIIATPNGEEDFLSHENWVNFIDLAKKAGNFIYGRKTYESVIKWPERFLKDIQDIPFPVVISNQLEKAGNGFIIAKSPENAIKTLEEKGCEKILLTGGSVNNNSFAKKGLIDEVIFNINPVIVGQGIPVFAADDFEIDLELIEHKTLNKDTVQLHYKVLK